MNKPPQLPKEAKRAINALAFQQCQQSYPAIRARLTQAALQAIAEGRNWDECLTIGAPVKSLAD